MKKLPRLLSFACVFFLAAACWAAPAGGIAVKAKDKKTGKVVYAGATSTDGKFATGNLDPGSYLFEFTSTTGVGFQVALAGAKSAKPIKGPRNGLAFAVEVGPAGKVSGKITAAEMTAAKSEGKSDPNVRIINGKRYVKVRGEIGSNMGEKWIPEEEAELTNPDGSRRSASEGLQKMQDLGSQGGRGGN